MFTIKSQRPLPSKGSTKYCGIAYDGCWFYLTKHCQREIVQFDACFRLENSFPTVRCYTCLCYDPRDNCFWASADPCLSTLFQLDDHFQEIDCLHIDGSDTGLGMGVITGVSYDCCDNMLIVAFASGFVRVDKCRGKVVSMKNGCTSTMGVVSVCPYTLCGCLAHQKKTIQVYDQCGALIKESPIPCTTSIQSAVFYPCTDDPSHWHFYVLTSKHNRYSYILECTMEWCAPLGPICDCNYQLCARECQCDEECTYQKSCTDILESIAMMEAALSHILNAEGEKLQKIIASTDDTCQILAANRAVNTTLVNATHLEHVLFHKLEVLKELCHFCEEEPCAHGAPAEVDCSPTRR